MQKSYLLGCIAADGSTFKPFVIVSRKTIEIELKLNGYTSEKVEIVHQENGFIDTFLFEKWADEIFFPEVLRRRAATGYNGRAIAILDGCSCYQSDWFLDECTFQNICVIFIASHSSDQTQPLDLGIFAICKGAQQRIRPNKDLSEQSKQIIKLLGGWQAATTPPNIISAFRAAGIISKLKHNILISEVDTSYAHKVRHFNIQNTLDPTVDKSRLTLSK